MPYGQIRIIGGQWKGRKLTVFNKKKLRPTTNRMRETLFNWLMPIIKGSYCLDCFAGSGALGIEALSRYAISATFIEVDRHIAKQLRANLAKIKARNAQIINDSALNYLTQTRLAYNVIFLDPPFRSNLLQQTAKLLEQNSWLIEDCWIYVETEAKTNLTMLPKNWRLVSQKISSQVGYYLYTRGS